MSAKSNKRAEPSGSASLPWKRLLLTSAGTAVLTVGLFFLAAIFLLRQDAGDDLLPVFAFLCCGLSALLGGFLCGKQMKRSGWLYGMLCTIPEMITLCVLCIALHGKAGKLLPAAAGLILLCGAAGGILSVNLRRKKRYR